MTKKFKRGYIEKYDNGGYQIIIAKVIQSDEFGKFEDIDEDEINRFYGYETISECFDDLKNYFKCKEIISEVNA